VFLVFELNADGVISLKYVFWSAKPVSNAAPTADAEGNL
jgi:hypothetical protein